MSDPILNVESSLMQARWVFAEAKADIVDRIVRQHGLPEIVARLLAARNVAPEDVEKFLNPRLGRDFPDPLSLAGMPALADDLAAAIVAGRKIGVFGDFDVDGATSTSVLVRFLRHCGQEPPFYIPDRLREGYGPNVRALQVLKDKGAEIVVLCDCGITAHDVVAQGRALGLDIVILDHHEAEEKLPPANHVIDPKRKDDTSGLSMLAACGVTFLACVAVNSRLSDLGFFQSRGTEKAPLKNWLDIVALGTVCDMVPLTGANRLFVRTGLAQMAATENAGLRALLKTAGVKEEVSPYHLGFILGPRINAGSRVDQADLGARLLSTDDEAEAERIAWLLNDCNEKRKSMQSEMFDHAVNLVEDQGLHNHPAIIVGHEDWHPGLSGLVAGRLREKYNLPSVVVTYAMGESGKFEGRGSARSVPGVNMGAAFIEGRNRGFLVKGGGHAMAAGFTVMPERLGEFHEFLLGHVSAQMDGQTAVTDMTIDGVLSIRGAQVDFVKLIHAHVGPFGQGHEEPLFALPSVRLNNVKLVGADHVSCQVSDWEGGSRLKAIAFRAAGTPLGDMLLKHSQGQYFHLVGHFKINEWQGRESVELHIQDAAPAQVQAGLKTA